jgi:hypothetical protein
MLNTNIISSICSYLNINCICKFHKIVKFHPHLQIWKEIDIVDEDTKLDDLEYVVNVFPIKSISLYNTHSNEFLDKLTYLTKFEQYGDNITLEQLVRIFRKSKNIKTLILRSNLLIDANDICTMQEFERLVRLELRQGCLVNNIYTFSHMTNLTHIDLSSTVFANINAFVGCENLRYLNLGNTRVIDISSLISCKKLDVLNLSETMICDISILEFSSIKNLNLENRHSTSLKDLSPIEKCKYLKYLNLYGRGSNTSKMPSFLKLDGLRELKLSYINNISELFVCKNLEILTIDYGTISDISALVQYLQLKELSLTNLPISDVSPIASCINLVLLRLSYLELLYDISPIANCLKLQKIYLYCTHINDISALSKLHYIEFLYMGLSISNVFPISSSCRRLKELKLTSSMVEDISVLADGLNLSLLSIYAENVSDISVLENCRKVRRLNLSCPKVSDISALGQIRDLRYLVIYNASITDISILERNKYIERIYLYNTHITDILPLINCKNLNVLQIKIYCCNISNDNIESFKILRPDVRVIRY